MIPRPAYITSGPHLSGYTVTLGYESLAEASEAHAALAAPQVGMSEANAQKTPPPNAGEGLIPLRSRNRTDCPGCGVASGYMHKADCPVLAQALRSNSPEAG